MVKKYLLDEMLSGNETICKNLQKQDKELVSLPNNMKGMDDRKIVRFAERKGYALITKDKKCAEYAKQLAIKTILIKD